MAIETAHRRPTPGRTAAGVLALGMVLTLGLDGRSGEPAPAQAAAPALPAPPANGELGFALISFHTPAQPSKGKEDCPDGPYGTLKEHYLALQTPAERARLLEPANERELQSKWQAYGRGPNNTNICTHINEFLDRPPTPMMKGSIGLGLDLDDDATGAPSKDGYTCRHDNFTSPTGDKGIDHQLWRVMGCNIAYLGLDNSGNGERNRGFDSRMLTGEWSQVIKLSGVNSLVNDPDVQVIYASTDDRPVVDSSGRPIHHASFEVASSRRKAKFRNVLRGRIVDGVLTTTPRDIILAQHGGSGASDGEFDFQRGRLRLVFQPDGTVKGMVGGYQPLLSLLTAQRGGGVGTINNGGHNCAGTYTALRMMADGDRDPKTGQCQRISYAFAFEAIPAFVNDVEPARRQAGR